MKFQRDTDQEDQEVPTMSTNLYVSNSGEMSCAEHGGGYLESALRADPRATFISTALAVWQRVAVKDFIAECVVQGDTRAEATALAICRGCQE